MKKNIGKTDRIIRLVSGIALLLVAFMMQSFILGFLGLFCLVEAASSWCVVYQLLGKSSCPR